MPIHPIEPLRQPRAKRAQRLDLSVARLLLGQAAVFALMDLLYDAIVRMKMLGFIV